MVPGPDLNYHFIILQNQKAFFVYQSIFILQDKNNIYIYDLKPNAADLARLFIMEAVAGNRSC